MSLDTEQTGSVGQFNPVRITDTGKVLNRPIANASQAHQIYTRFERDNIARSLRNKVVNDKYNLMPPYSQTELNGTAQGWRANFHTGFIGTVNDRVTPRLTDTVHNMKYLTNAAIPDSWPEADDKTQKFREHLTNTIRSWVGWNDFIDQVAAEDSYFGFTIATWLGEYEWRPQTFRQDEMYFDEHSRQHASELPVFAVRKSYYPYQLVDMMDDNETNQQIGYKVKNISAAVRAATNPVLRPNVDIRLLSDIVREGTLYYTYHRMVRVVESVHMYCQTYDNSGIEHWWFNRKRENPPKRGQITTKSSADESEAGPESKEEEEEDDDPILFLHETFDDMAMVDFVTLFTFEVGNNRLYGSKGIGRKLANLDTVINRVRCSAIDSAFIAQTLVGKVSESSMARVMPTLRYPFMWVPEGVEMLAQQFQSNIDTFLALDRQLVSYAEQIVGAYLPDPANTPSVPPETATAEAIDAQREEEVKQGMLNRWWRQFGEMTQAMQRRMCNSVNLQLAIDIFERKKKLAIPKNGKAPKMLVPSEMYEQIILVGGDPNDMYEPMPKLGRGDQDAVDMLLRMLEDELSPAEIIAAAHSKNTEPTQLTSQKEIVQFQQFYQAMAQFPTGTGNPNLDWPTMTRILAQDAIGTARSKEVIVQDQGQTSQTEQARLQLMEAGTIMSGDQVPVSPRDDHMVHLQTLMPKIATQVQAMKAVPPENIQQPEMDGVSRQLDHAKMHVSALQQGGKQAAPPEMIKQTQNQIQDALHELSLMAQAKTQAMALAMAMQQRQQAAAANQPFEPEETQLSPNGQPIPNGQQMEQLRKNSGNATGALHRDKRV